MVSGVKFKVFGSIRFPSASNEGEDFWVTTEYFGGKDYIQMLIELISKTEMLLQSNNEVSLKNFQCKFGFLIMPAGGAYTVNRDRESILGNKSVNKVINTDNNCFWHALTNLIHGSHAKKKKKTR